MTQLRIGIVGDLHTHWDEVDVAQFDASDYDLLYFTGDLGGGTRSSSLRMARLMSRLRKPALVMPGNNDTFDISELAAELALGRGIRRLAAMRDGRDAARASVRLCGYSIHRMERGRVEVTLIAARPHSMGGAELSFPDHMRACYGVESIEQSRDRLFALVDQSTERVIFLSHNGPRGLGDSAHDMWGCDFKPGGGDWGDPDLAAAIDYAVGTGRRVLAVVAGHMHLRTKCGAERPWCVDRDGILYVNAARVPRIGAGDDGVVRHHVSLLVDRDGTVAREVFVPHTQTADRIS